MTETSATWPDPDVERRREAWRSHLPKRCRILFIGEAPPPEARYFYYPESDKYDFLFMGLIPVLYPKLRDFDSNHIRAQKPALLRRFADDGYLLIDAVERRIPLDGTPAAVEAIKANQADLLRRLKAVGHNDFVAIPVKVSVQDGLSPEAKSRIGSLFITDRIPFPSTGQQTNFRRKLGLVLDNLVAPEAEST